MTIPKLLVITLGVLTFLAPVRAQERNTCVRARVPEAYALPDGSVHEGGMLTLCLTETLSPVSGLHKVAVEGHAVGLARSRRHLAEDREIETPMVLFQRRDGRLELIGYVVRVDRKTWSYSLAEPARKSAPGELVAVLGRRD